MNSEIDKYINPKKSVFVGIVIFIVTICVFFAWASLAELSSAVIIPGVIEAYGKKKIVQSLQGGMINQILVKNGDQVNKGDLLVQLDSTIDESDRIVAEKEYISYSVSAARAMAELTNEPNFPHPELENKVVSVNFLENTMSVERFFFDTRRSELNSSVDVVEKRLKRLKEAHFGLSEELRTYHVRKKLVDEELEAMNELYQNGYVSRTKILSLKREQADVEGTVVNLISRIKQTKWEVSELEQQVVTLKETYRREAATHLKEAESGKLKAYERMKATQFLTKCLTEN